VQQPGEPDGLGDQVHALQRLTRTGRVPLVEDEVEHVQDHPEPLGALWLGGQIESRPGVADALLGPGNALGDGGLGNQERGRDLRSGQAADRAQGERELGGRRQRGMAAQEQ